MFDDGLSARARPLGKPQQAVPFPVGEPAVFVNALRSDGGAYTL